jgi:hypothetical protein
MHVASKSRPSSFAHEKGRVHSLKGQSGTMTTQKYRGMINRHLASMGKQLELDHRGLCNFQCGTFVMVLEVPWDSKVFLLYTSVMKCRSLSTAVMRKALELNYMTRATNSCTLALVPSRQDNDMEITLCRSHRIDGTNSSHVISLVRNFLRTATSVQTQLDRARQSNISTITSSLSHQPKSCHGKRIQQQSQKPPPPPYEQDMTPTISNKAVDKGLLSDIRQQSISGNSQRVTFLKDLAKAALPLGLTVAATTRSYCSKVPPKTVEVMRRLSRMASKTLQRPRALGHSNTMTAPITN